MAIHDSAAETLASLFHHYQSALGADFGDRAECSPEWDELADNQRRRIVAAVRLALIDYERTTVPPVPDNEPNIFTTSNGGKEGKECGC